MPSEGDQRSRATVIVAAVAIVAAPLGHLEHAGALVVHRPRIGARGEQKRDARHVAGRAAACNGVHPPDCRAFGSAPASSSTPTTSAWLPLAAECSGVPVIQPVPRASTSAAWFTSSPRRLGAAEERREMQRREAVAAAGIDRRRVVRPRSSTSRSRSPAEAASNRSIWATRDCSASTMTSVEPVARPHQRRHTLGVARGRERRVVLEHRLHQRSTSPAPIAANNSSDVLAIGRLLDFYLRSLTKYDTVRAVTTPGRTSPARDVDAVADRLHSAAIHLLRRLRVEDEALGISAPRLSALSVARRYRTAAHRRARVRWNRSSRRR